MIEYLIRKKKITLLFFIMIVLLGLLSFLQLGRRETPEITVNVATVTTAYPGATPEQVEQTVTKKLEEKINELQGLKSIVSESSAGVSIIVVEARDGIDPKRKWEELRLKVQDAVPSLPKDAKQPVINDDLNRTFVQTFAVYADTWDQLYARRDLLKSWKDQLRTIPHVADVSLQGLPEKQVRVELDTRKLQQMGLSFETVLAAVQKANEKTPLGDLQIGDQSFELRLVEEKNVERLADALVVRDREGRPVYVKDVARVRMTTERVKDLCYYNGKPAVVLSINAESGVDVPALQKRVDERMAFLQLDKPADLHVTSIYSQNERVQELFGELVRELIIAVAAVLFVCTLGLNPVTAFVVALAIPISIAVGMIPLPYLGMSLNQISIVGLIIVLGILVDDAVVVNDNIERRLSALGERPGEAAIRGSREVSGSILTATLATICSFGPLFFLSGNAGQFIRVIPLIVSLSMLASMAVSLTIIPIFREWYEERRKGRSKEEQYRKPAGLLGRQIEALTRWYGGRLMPRMLQRPLVTGLVGLLLGTAAYGLIPFTPVQLFPPAERAELYVNIRAPSGSSLSTTDRLVRDVSGWLQSRPGVQFVSAFAGADAPKMFSGATNNGGGEAGGQIVFRVDRSKIGKTDFVEKWNEQLKEQFPGSSIVIKRLETGPPVGPPVEVRIYGNDLDTLRQAAQSVKEEVGRIPGTRNLRDSLGVEHHTLQFHMQKGTADALSVSISDTTRALRLLTDGLSVGQYDEGRDLVDIVATARSEGSDPAAAYRQLTVTNARGEPVPLPEIVSAEPGFATATIPHRDLSRVVTVYADVAPGLTATEVVNELKPKLARIQLPPGYRFEIGGETSEQTDIFLDMGKLSVIVLFLILILITLQFYSLSVPLLVMSTIYLAFGGSLIGLFATRTPLGFMTMMGVVSLAGIVVRNGIVFIEFIEHARRGGMELKEAVIRAGEARLRPILLTSATAVAGLFPLAVSGDVLFRPMAVTIISGLTFSTLLTLIIVPCWYTVLARWKLRRGHRAEL
ncbi:MAG: efflux RND transporter permease subunit, partial [Kyrpidia sp.]|nr:efflux RND transporter permease subunit [Kyrpidia sp.]